LRKIYTPCYKRLLTVARACARFWTSASRCSAALEQSDRERNGEMANQLGKVYICAKCGSQVIVTKGGTGVLKCCGAPMEQKK